MGFNIHFSFESVLLLPGVTRQAAMPQPKGQEEKLDEYALGKHKDNGYYISIDPFEPVRPRFGIADILGHVKYNYRVDLSSPFEAWIPRCRSEPGEHRLTKVISDDDSNIYTTQIGSRTYAVKLGDNPKQMADELQLQVHVCGNIKRFWDVATEKSPGLPSPYVPRPESQIVAQRRFVWGTVCAGFMMEYIPPLPLHHAKALTNTFLDPILRKLLEHEPGLANVRLHVLMGMMAPKNEAGSAKPLSQRVYFDQLRCETNNNLETWAKVMGASLAILHWACGIDAFGVQFRLGLNEQSKPVLWMTNFGDCRPFDPINLNMMSLTMISLASALTVSSTWPRPLFCFALDPESDDGKAVKRMWTLFRRVYLAASNSILRKVRPKTVGLALPALFMSKLQLMWLRQKT